MNHIIFHIDVNSAFLSWTALSLLEQGAKHDLRLIPSVIGGDSKSRHGVVLAKSSPAKTYGIQTGEPIINALRKCPSLVIAPPDHSMYKKYSRHFIEYLTSLCPIIEQVSIDECYMDYSPISGLYTNPLEAARYLKDSVREKFGFTVNIGISDRKVLAKMASDFKKPDCIHTLFSWEIREKMWPLPVDRLYMCGPSSVEVLRNLEILTIGDLAQADPGIISLHLKNHGLILWDFANGRDHSTVDATPYVAKGIGNSTTLKEDATTYEEACQVFAFLAESVSGRLKKAGQTASMVSCEIKYHTFRTASHQTTLPSPTDSATIIYETACRLFRQLWDETPIRLLGIRTSKLTEACAPKQMSLFDFSDFNS